MKLSCLIGLMCFLLAVDSSYAGHPFSYDLHLTRLPCKGCKVMITAHGMGANYKIAESVRIERELVSFNFPDYDFGTRMIQIDETTFGTIDELLPLLYVIRQCVVEEGLREIDLYGFSAGGGAIINGVGALNTSRFDKELQKIGISQKEKEQMLLAIQKGVIILDVPLKSFREVLDFQGPEEGFELLAKRYEKNDMEPIEALKYLEGLSLTVTLHFQNPDEILSNRDDTLFFNRLKSYNKKGVTNMIVGKDGGHGVFHTSLWNSLEYK